MKKKDLMLIIVVVIVSGVVSVVTARLVFGNTKTRSAKVEIVDAITSDFDSPDTRYFNNQSVNPTKLIEIGESTNQTPFNSKP